MENVLENLLSKAKLAVAPDRLTRRHPVEKELHLLACLCREESNFCKGPFFLTRPQIQRALGLSEETTNRYMKILLTEGFLLVVERARFNGHGYIGNRYRWIEMTDEARHSDSDLDLNDYIPWP